MQENQNLNKSSLYILFFALNASLIIYGMVLFLISKNDIERAGYGLDILLILITFSFNFYMRRNGDKLDSILSKGDLS